MDRETTKRHADMYEMLSEKSMSAKELTEELNHKGFKIGQRSVQRDLNALKGFNGLIFKTVGTTKRRRLWSVKTIDFTSPGKLDEAGALAIVTAQKQLELTAPRSVTASLQDAFDRANEIISQSNSRETKWHKRVRVVTPSHWLKPPKLNDEDFNCIRTAVSNNKAVRFKYEKHSSDEPKQKVGTALGLYYRGPVAYLIMFNHKYQIVENYPISRIKEPAISLTETAHGVDSFDFDDFVETGYLAYRYGEPFRLKAMVFNSVRREIEEAHLGDKQILTLIEDNEKFQLLEVDVPYTLNLIQWLLARAAYLKVLGPPAFKAKFEEEIKRAFYNVGHDAPNVPSDKNFVTNTT
jgi:predicted DNA-binding transcriptional regulator YafY